ncbi:nitroreductase [Arcobacteraceae bacterium]|nr:nitroreductase [Arcobacteraceae bacterium]
MNVTESLINRKSVRAFLKQEVPKEKIEHILNTAKHAPSGVNMQPWVVSVVSKDTKKTIETKMEELFVSDSKENMDYNYYPLQWDEPYKSRRKETGLLMYKTLDIKREDKEKQLEQWKANYRAFDAPVVLYFFIDENLEKGSYLDYGMFLQSVMLSAVEVGLGTCTQAALAQYPEVVKAQLNIPQNLKLLCGMALGYEDKEAIVNSYRTTRIDLEEFVSFHE